MKLTTRPSRSGALRQRGFSLVELMISVTISMVVLAGLIAVLVNISRSNAEMAKSNSQIENGRFAIQVLEKDLVHAGFWGEYVPQFDDVSWMFVASDAPNAVPDPCKAYAADDFNDATVADWDFSHINNLLGIPVQVSPAAPGTCVLANKVDNTDVLVVRHAATCVAGEPNCEPNVTPGKLYFQEGMCTAGTWGQAQLVGNSNSTIALVPPSSTSNTSAIVDGYVGMRIRLLEGTGAGQTRVISAYSGPTNIATVTPNWSTAPAFGTKYTIVDEALSTDALTLRRRSCVAAERAPVRKFESNIYYIRNYASSVGDGIPTLMRSTFDPGTAVALSHQPGEALVEGIERFSVELGIDHTLRRCNLNTAVQHADKIEVINPATCAASAAPNEDLNTLPRNRGDGNADEYIRCTAAAPCAVDKLRNAVAAKIFLLVRNTQVTLGHVDDKTYCLASVGADGVCPDLAGPFNDGYKRHLFSTTIRLTAISGRRETP